MKIAMRCIHALLLLFLVGVFLAGASNNRYDLPVGDCPSLGPENAPVTIFEFIDYQ
jgi:hypothetical protein